MELITPYVEIVDQDTRHPLEGMYEHIARCTRVCYQSTPMNNGETDEEFVKRVILRHEPWNSEANHLAMLEHGTVYLFVDANDNDKYKIKDDYESNKYSKVKYFGNSYCSITSESPVYITTNLRVLVENNWLGDLRYICAPTEYHARRVTVFFTTNIGVTREFNRHRVNSIAEESTRYCNYNKRNDGQIKIGTPAWMTGDDCPIEYIKDLNKQTLTDYVQDIIDYEEDINALVEIWDAWGFYFMALKMSEFCYNGLIKSGWKPQQAREVLPLATKSQLVHTAFVDDWKHFFALRADGISGPPHPNAKLLAAPLKEKFIKRKLI